VSRTDEEKSSNGLKERASQSTERVEVAQEENGDRTAVETVVRKRKEEEEDDERETAVGKKRGRGKRKGRKRTRESEE
jgi:hypothetical protein